MKLLFVNQFYRPDHSATAQLLTDLAEYMARRGHDVTVLTGRGGYEGGVLGPARQRIGGLAVRRLRTFGFGRRTLAGRALDYLCFYMGALLWVLQHGRAFDVVVTLTTPPLIGLVGAAMHRLFDTRFVLWSMDLYPNLAVALGRMTDRCPLTDCCRWLARRVDRSASDIVALGHDMAEALTLQGADPRHITIIDNWAPGDIRPVDDADNPLLDEWSLRDVFTVMYSGNLGLAHRFDTVLQAAQRLRHDNSVHFVFAGGGARLPEVRHEAEKHQLANVTFRPYQPIGRLSEALSAARLHLVTQRDETLGLIVPSKLYGILAAGRPVVYVGPPESHAARLVAGSGCGAVVLPGDVDGLVETIGRLKDDPLAWQECCRRAQRFYEDRLGKTRSLAAWATLIEG